MSYKLKLSENLRHLRVTALAAFVVLLPGGFLFAAHRQSRNVSMMLRQDLLNFQHEQQEAVELSKTMLLSLQNNSSVGDLEIDKSLASMLLMVGSGVIQAQDELSSNRLHKVLRNELRPLYQQQDFTTAHIENTLYHTCQEMQNLIMSQNISSSTVEYALRQQQRADRIVPIAIALLIIVGGWAMERRLKNDWKETLELVRVREVKYKTDLEEAKKSIVQVQQENENLKQLLETSRESVPYSMVEKMQLLESNVKNWESECKLIQAENERLKENADAQRWEKERLRLQQENQKLRDFSGPTDMAEMRREFAKIKSELKETETKNTKLNEEIKRLKLEKETEMKAKQRRFFKS